MLNLSRKINQRIRIDLPTGDPIWITVTKIQGGRVGLGITAPPEYHVQREEVIGRASQTGTNSETPQLAEEEVAA